MLFWTTIKVALKSLAANKLRTFLAMLGIVIGVCAVVSMLALGAGARAQVMTRLESMGTDLLIVRPGQRGMRGVSSGTQQNLTVEDSLAILGEVEGVYQVAPVVSGSAQIKYSAQNTRTSVVGASVTYFGARGFAVERGRVFTEQEAERMARVALVGPVTAENLFAGEEPVGAVVKINGINFTVAGVLKAKGDQGWYNPDDQIIVPYTTAMKQLFGLDYLREINVQAWPKADLDAVQEAVTALLRARHRTPADMPEDFNIRNQAEMIETASSVSRTFSFLLGGIASISLLVGGIGIMNIMLVTVTERTREIGLRKAIGAKSRDILGQFLIEAILLSGIGGLLGLLAGVGGAQAIGRWSEFQTAVEPHAVLLALGFATGIGIFFGYYPASRAARLDPIEALRHE